MIDIAVSLEKIEGSRISQRVSENAPLKYNLNVSLSEKERSPEVLVLGFNLELRSHPPAARILVSGTATLKGSKDEIQRETTSADDDTPPRILTNIYESLYGLVYIVAGSLKVAQPLPNLLKGAQVKVEVGPGRTSTD
jgi:hypothetical protein